VGTLVDRADIQDLISGYFLAFEERRFDEAWLQATFTEDVVVEFRPGTHAGTEGLAEFHQQVAARWGHSCQPVHP
jgi:SnoaL-like domain